MLRTEHWFDLISARKFSAREVVVEQIRWDDSVTDDIKNKISSDGVYTVQVYFKEVTRQKSPRRLTDEFTADENGSTQNGFGWLVTVTTIITAAMIGISFYLFAPMRAVRM